MNKDRELEVVDSKEVDVDPMEIVVNVTILYKTRVNLNGKIMRKARISGKVVVPTEEVLVHTKKDIILTLEVVFTVNISNVVKKGIDPLNANTLAEVKVVAKIL